MVILCPKYWATLTLSEKYMQRRLIDAIRNKRNKRGDTALHTAVRRKDAELIQFLLANGMDEQANNKDSMIPLALAVELEYVDGVRLLIQNKAILHIKPDFFTNAPLLIAVKKANLVIIQLLLDAGAKIHISCGQGYPLLHHAVLTGSLETVELLVKRGANVNNASIRRSPLHTAAQKGDEKIAIFLLANGANINAIDNEGVTPLNEAISYKHGGLAKIFIEKKADVNAARRDGATPLHAAAQLNLPDIAVLLIAQHAVIDPRSETGITPLMLAAGNKNHDTAQLLIEKGANVNAACTDDGATPLDYAVGAGDLPMVSLLLAKGAKVDAVDSQKNTALHQAAMQNFAKIAEILLVHHAKVDAVNDEGITPLMYAAMNGKCEVARVLLNNGANANATDTVDGMTPLHCAALEGHADIVQLLLGKTDINKGSPPEGSTALMLASQRNHTGVIKILIANGAIAHLAREDRSTALHIAARNGHVESVNLLLQQPGVNVNAETCFYVTPLHLAATYGHTVVVQTLLAHHANAATMCSRQTTPYSAAKAKGHKDVAEILLEHLKTQAAKRTLPTSSVPTISADTILCSKQTPPLITTNSCRQDDVVQIPLAHQATESAKRPRPSSSVPTLFAEKRPRLEESTASSTTSNTPIVKMEVEELTPLTKEDLHQATLILRGKSACEINCVYLAMDLLTFIITRKQPTQASKEEQMPMNDFNGWVYSAKTNVTVKKEKTKTAVNKNVTQVTRSEITRQGVFFNQLPVAYTVLPTQIGDNHYDAEQSSIHVDELVADKLHYKEITAFLRQRANITASKEYYGALKLERAGATNVLKSAHLIVFYATTENVYYICAQKIKNGVEKKPAIFTSLETNFKFVDKYSVSQHEIVYGTEVFIIPMANRNYSPTMEREERSPLSLR